MVKPRPKFKCKGGRIRNPKKIQRWSKGDSCLSNPEVTKYRDQASSLNFHQVLKNPLLTERNLGNLPKTHHLDDLGGIEDDTLSFDIRSLTISDARTGFGGSASSYNTAKTFASNWSKCSNGAFEKFLGRFKLDSALHKEMLSILAATTEIINSMGGTHRETEYFASFVTALDKCDVSQYEAMMALLSIISGRVPEAVLRKTFSTVYPRIATILSYAIDNFNNSLMRITCNVLKQILGAQDPSVFESELQVQSLIYGILRCCLHENPKVRRKARLTIGFILLRQKERNGDDTVVAKIVMGWILDELSTYPTSGPKSASDAIGLLQFVWSTVDHVSVKGAKKIYESVLRIMSSGDVSLMKIGFSFFTKVFETFIPLEQPSTSKTAPGLTTSFTPKLFVNLWEFVPNPGNREMFICWIQCIMNGLIRLAEEDINLAGSYLSRAIEKLSETWNSSDGGPFSKVFTNFLYHIIRPEMKNDDIDACFGIILKNLFSIPPNPNCLLVLQGLIKPLKPDQFTISAREVLLRLVQLKNSPDNKTINTILGQYVASFGVDNLWISVDPETRHGVIFPLLKNNLSGGELTYWKKEIFPLIHTEKYIKYVWESLVGFCRDPVDPDNFPAELVGNTIDHKTKFRLIALTALKQFALWPQSQKILEKHANNFIPILFTLYVHHRQSAFTAKKLIKKKISPEDEDEMDHSEEMEGKNLPADEKVKRNIEFHMGHSDATATTIQKYLPHLKPTVIQDFIERAINKYDEIIQKTPKGKIEDEIDEYEGPYLDLINFLASFQLNEKTLNKVYEIATSIVSDNEHMKQGYRILFSILKNESVSDEIKTKVIDVLRNRDVKSKIKSNAVSLRLECIHHLIFHFQNEEWLLEFLPEIILCLLSVNTNGRKIAKQFVEKLCDELKEKKFSVEKIHKIVVLGLESGIPFTITSFFNFLILLYRHVPPTRPDELLINSSITHLMNVDKWDPNLSREALSFLSINLSIHKSEMGIFAESIGKIIQGPMNLPRKEVNKILARMIKFFGMAGLKAVLPNSDDVKMNVRIKNIQRKIKIKQRGGQREKTEEDQEESDDDSGDDDEDNRGSGKGKRRTNNNLVMKEGVVDFLDLSTMSKSFFNPPNKEEKIETFEFSKDGKLIIKNLDDEDEDKKRGKKRSLQDQSLEEDDSSDSDDDKPVKKTKRRDDGGKSIASGSSKRSWKTMKTASVKSKNSSIGGVSSKAGFKNPRKSQQLKRMKRSPRSEKSDGVGKSFRSKKHRKSPGSSSSRSERFNYKR